MLQENPLPELKFDSSSLPSGILQTTSCHRTILQMLTLNVVGGELYQVGPTWALTFQGSVLLWEFSTGEQWGCAPSFFLHTPSGFLPPLPHMHPSRINNQQQWHLHPYKGWEPFLYLQPHEQAPFPQWTECFTVQSTSDSSSLCISLLPYLAQEPTNIVIL